MRSKELLYSLIIDFVNSRMFIDQFCSMFEIGYCTDTDYDELTPEEHQLFRELCTIVARYAEDEECLKYPNVYYTDKEVVKKVQEVCDKLGIPR